MLGLQNFEVRLICRLEMLLFFIAADEDRLPMGLAWDIE